MKEFFWPSIFVKLDKGSKIAFLYDKWCTQVNAKSFFSLKYSSCSLIKTLSLLTTGIQIGEDWPSEVVHP